MAHFMPDSSEKVLDCLYQSIGNKAYRVSGWGNTTKGYGLKPSEFNRFSGCSRSVFYKCRKHLLAQKLIDVINTNKTKQSNHKPRYYITFLGIIKLFQKKVLGVEEFNFFIKSPANSFAYNESTPTVFHSEGVDFEQIDEYDYLNLWYDLTELKRPDNVHDAIIKMFENIEPALLCQVLSEILKGIEFRESSTGTDIILSMDISKHNRVTLWKFTLKNGIINCILSPDPQESREWDDDYVTDDLPLDEFYFLLCEFILEGMWYILSKYHFRKLPKYLVQGNTQQDIAQDSGPIDYFIDMFNEYVTMLALKM
ncbi:MAG: hypothetical protein QXG67_02865 [Candidatus Nitrosotenuis sp.]